MERVILKKTGLSVSPVCLGTANFGLNMDRQKAFAVLDAFADMGGSFLDTANVYCKWVPGVGNCSETVIGQWLKSRGMANRMVIATKGGHYAFSDPSVSRVTEKDVREDLEESLKALGLDCIDVYWLHRDNPALSVETISDFMERLVREGKIRFWGISNITAERAMAFAPHIFGVSNQWSLAVESREMASKKDPTTVWTDQAMRSCLQDKDLSLVPYTAGAHGCFAAMEAGRPCRGLWDHPGNRNIFQVLRPWADRLGVSCYVLGQAWLLHQSFQVIPVMAVSRAEQLLAFEQMTALKVPDACMQALAAARQEL